MKSYIKKAFLYFLLVIFVLFLAYSLNMFFLWKVPLLNPMYRILEYRDVTLYFHPKVVSEEKQNLLFEVIDSLYEDVNREYSLNEMELQIVVLTNSNSWIFINPKDKEGAAGFVNPYENTTIFLTQCIFEAGDNGLLAMSLIHEYVHLVQFSNEDYLMDYKTAVGWTTDLNGEEVLLNKNTFEEYGTLSPYEDMSITFQYPYLCGNKIDFISPERLEAISTFWKGEREEYCKNFP